MTMSNTKPVDLTKTLVIGLGSTGTQVCNGILRRLEWEFGSANHAPWVQFMAIETNNNEPTALRQRGDFLSIGLDTQAYGQLLEDPQNSKINLGSWADMPTLRKLKNTIGGAGNIRMVGRLTFLTDPNFSKVKRGLLDRLGTLRDLSAAEAFQTRGPLVDGSNPQIQWGSGGQIRVFVVGTLCGGTCSGLAPDFGYFLRTGLVRKDEKIIGIFTLPHENLTSVTASNASRLKRNAYHALLELNHYHQADADTLPPIKYPDDKSADLRTEPYDLPYLVSPSSPTKLGEKELNELVSDRIFMNIVSPDADPISIAADAPLPDRDHQAHVFNTFGLSVVEFPAPQITEAASKKLLHGALDSWQAMKSGRAQDLTTGLGLDWTALVGSLLQRPTEEWQSEVVKDAVDQIGEGKPDFSKLDRALGEVRQQVGPGGGLSDRLRAHRDQVVETIYLKFQQHAQQALLDRTYGPQVLTTEVEGLLAYLQQLHDAAREYAGVAQAEAGDAWKDVDDGVAQLKAALKRKSLLNPNRASIDKAQAELRRAIREFAKIQVESSVHASIQTHQAYGTIDLGVAEKLQRLLQRVLANLKGLDARITAQKNKLYADSQARASDLPPINGLVLLEPRTTVLEEYRRALEANKQSSVEHLDNIEARFYHEIISSWTDLPNAVVPPLNQIGNSWISATFDIRGEHLIPESDYQKLLRIAIQPFVTILAQENVIERVMRDRQTNPAMESKIRAAAEQAQPFLTLNRSRAEEGNRSPVMHRQALLTPTRTNPTMESEFTQLVGGVFSSSNTVYLTSPDPTRALFLEEYFRFPLRGLDQVLGDGGLQSAECNDFPTFHTRRDVNWYGLSKREGQLLAQAQEVLILGVILGEITVQDGLRIPWTITGFGDRDFRLLPTNLPEAARILARGEQDKDGYSMIGALPTIQAKIEQHWKRYDIPMDESSQAFIGHLEMKLKEFYRQGRAGQIQGWGDELWTGEHLLKYTAKHAPLQGAASKVYWPPAAIINSLTFRQGQTGPWNGEVPEDGLYCTKCGGKIGTTPEDAAQNGWRCFIDSTHVYRR
ncbi:hypothetical protein FNU79_14015 [Deinococcus detaillensis]|uniref:Tubulin like n=1 Tax=Deinococcus detaillensis TaxID=2592048 RepID=A0A553UQ83_9DEIO|nr:tubulin-like doman-containing protein [Deinococcus detaillensis]TSA82131.1 hypothetical protein FNU79_14015 [Deinococcus detaillensis]